MSRRSAAIPIRTCCKTVFQPKSTIDGSPSRSVTIGTGRVFPSIGDAEWLALGATSDDRHNRSKELRGHIAEWTADKSSDDIVALLQAKRIPAAEIMTELRLLEDAHLEEREWFKERQHPAVGTYRYPGPPWQVQDGFDTAFERPLPGFGEDNEYVYKDLLGYSAEEFESLVQQKLVTDEQFA